MKKILQIDGGGVRGIMPALVLAHLEEKCGKPLSHCFDLITGTSVGALTGGALAAGVPASEIADILINKSRQLFTRRTLLNPINWLRSRYDRQPFLTEFGHILGVNPQGKRSPLDTLTLADLNTRFMATTFNLSSQRTHFIKSWHQEHQAYHLLDVMAWSGLSAVYYFGKINVAEYQWFHYQPERLTAPVAIRGAVFQDGGQGVHNNTLGYILTKMLADRWTYQETVYILSLGTGYYDEYIPYKIAKKFNLIAQVKAHLLCQAGKESMMDQVLAANYVASDPTKAHPNILFKRIDKKLAKEEVGLDKVHYIDRYQQYGNALKENIQETDIKILCGD